MKRLLSIAIAFILIASLFCGCSEEEGLPEPTEKFFVNDFANVISDSDENEIQSKAVTLNNKTTAQVVVVTVESLNGAEPADYALELGQKWGVGTKEDNNGIVILLSENDREIYIAVGYGLEGALPDSKTGRIIDVYGLNHLRNNDFSTGIKAIATAVINEVYIEYGITAEEGYTPIDNISEQNDLEESPGSVVIYWIIMLVVVFIVLRILSGRRRFFWFGGPGPFMGGGFSGGFTGGRGGFSGGGFSGGGGSFGGGGAGRGF